jgi:hypothetical protein
VWQSFTCVNVKTKLAFICSSSKVYFDGSVETAARSRTNGPMGSSAPWSLALLYDITGVSLCEYANWL